MDRGQNLEIHVRWGNADPARIEAFAKELVELRPDAILGQTTPVVRALARNTQEIPIVFVQVSDPVGSGFAASLAWPNGNITGFATDNSSQGGKWVELLKEIAPHTQHMRVAFNPETAAPSKYFMPSIQAKAAALAVQVSAAPVHSKDDFEGTISAMAAKSGAGLIITPDPFNVANRDLIIRLAAQYAVPAIYFHGCRRADRLWQPVRRLLPGKQQDMWAEFFKVRSHLNCPCRPRRALNSLSI